MRNLIIYGGTFDPIHNGHLQIAKNIQQQFHFDQFIFLPCKAPVINKKNVASALERLTMLELALAKEDIKYHFTIDLVEINRATPSYMVHSLGYFRKKYGEQLPITLLLGLDAFYQLPQWHAWQQLLTLANILVVKRPAHEVLQAPAEIKILLAKHQTEDKSALLITSNGLVYSWEAGQFNISSSLVREKIFLGQEVNDLIPEAVSNYIEKHAVYRKQS